MAWTFGAAFLYAIVAMVMGFRNFLRDAGATVAADGRTWMQAVRDAMTLRYLDGGGVGCMNEDDKPRDTRRLYHHLTFYGFMLCFASTSVATLYHYLLGREAPYPWWDLPVVLGTVGGVGLVIGTAGLLVAKFRRMPALVDLSSRGMDIAFILMLFLTALTGLLLMGLRETAAMGSLLAVHLGVVFALFISMPYGKFVHGLYRFGALLLYARERPDPRPARAAAPTLAPARQ
jgi:citrate/tricarballylate utilization protein